MCEPCRENRRAAKRVRHAERRAAGLCVKCATPTYPAERAYCDPCAKAKYGRRKRDPEARREADRRRYAERRARGDCTTCGKPANGAAECKACCDAARERYHARRAAGVCVKCKTPVFGGTAYCAPCSVAKNERRDREAEYAERRRRYAERARAKGRCVECNAPSPGVARCEPCSRKHRESVGGVSRHPGRRAAIHGRSRSRRVSTTAPMTAWPTSSFCLAFAKLSAAPGRGDPRRPGHRELHGLGVNGVQSGGAGSRRRPVRTAGPASAIRIAGQRAAIPAAHRETRT